MITRESYREAVERTKQDRYFKVIFELSPLCEKVVNAFTDSVESGLFEPGGSSEEEYHTQREPVCAHRVDGMCTNQWSECANDLPSVSYCLKCKYREG